jgi:hypothetical protein
LSHCDKSFLFTQLSTRTAYGTTSIFSICLSLCHAYETSLYARLDFLHVEKNWSRPIFYQFFLVSRIWTFLERLQSAQFMG